VQVGYKLAATRRDGYAEVVKPTPLTLDDLRSHIDRLDAALVYLLAERYSCTDEIGRLKKHEHLPPLDAEREERQKARLRAIAGDAGVDADTVIGIFDTITATVKERHQRTIESD
jgi:chorismate mutase